MLKLIVLLYVIFSIDLCVNIITDQTKCCQQCYSPKAKYYSVDKLHNMCGQACMDPKDYPIYKIFELGLTLAKTNTPCYDLSFPKFNGTVTHGVGTIKMTLDLYAH